MYSAAGLEAWEIIVASGLCAVGFLSVSTVFAVAFSIFVTREPRAATAQVPATARPAVQAAGTGYPTFAHSA